VQETFEGDEIQPGFIGQGLKSGKPVSKKGRGAIPEKRAKVCWEVDE